jgi:hypothetical protein
MRSFLSWSCFGPWVRPERFDGEGGRRHEKFEICVGRRAEPLGSLPRGRAGFGAANERSCARARPDRQRCGVRSGGALDLRTVRKVSLGARLAILGTAASVGALWLLQSVAASLRMGWIPSSLLVGPPTRGKAGESLVLHYDRTRCPPAWFAIEPLRRPAAPERFFCEASGIGRPSLWFPA